MKKLLAGLLTTLPTICLASYVSYTNSVVSVPDQSGFYYSDGQGNSISIQRTQSVPVYIANYPNAVWVPMANGSVPSNAIIMQYVNGFPVFYCKVQFNNQIAYGQLYPNEGCILNDSSNHPYHSYFVLIR